MQSRYYVEACELWYESGTRTRYAVADFMGGDAPWNVVGYFDTREDAHRESARLNSRWARSRA